RLQQFDHARHSHVQEVGRIVKSLSKIIDGLLQRTLRILSIQLLCDRIEEAREARGQRSGALRRYIGRGCAIRGLRERPQSLDASTVALPVEVRSPDVRKFRSAKLFRGLA